MSRVLLLALATSTRLTRLAGLARCSFRVPRPSCCTLVAYAGGVNGFQERRGLQVVNLRSLLGSFSQRLPAEPQLGGEKRKPTKGE